MTRFSMPSRMVSLVLIAITLGLPSAASAQMVQYTTETTFKIDAFGAIGRMFGRKPMTSTTYVTREQMATVTGDAARCFDVAPSWVSSA